jgi:PAS domain S-box-containing protein
MVTMMPSNGQAAGFANNPAPLMTPPETVLVPGYGAAGVAEGVEARNHQLTLLAEVNAALAGARDVESVLGTILTRLAERERLTYARLYRLDEAAHELRRIAWAGRNGIPRQGISLPGHTHLAWAIEGRRPVYIPRAAEDPRCQGMDTDIACTYAVPLQTGTRVLGVLEVAAAQTDGIRLGTRQLIDQVATQAALALERHELYQQLRVSEERFRSIFEQIDFGVALASLDGQLSTVNPAFARLLGYKREELQGKHLAEVTDPQDRPAFEERRMALLAGKVDRFALEGRYVGKSGDSLWCETRVSLLHNAAGQPAYLLSMVHDIDERKKSDEERGRLQQQLFQAQKMEALGTLAGGIAHDFNNLLNVMLGFASLARQRLNPDDSLQESLSMIEQSAQRAADLTHQLLAFARPERQKVRPVCVDEVLERVRRMVARTFDRSITVIYRKEAQPLWVNAEPSFLEQALLNLCINARDAMPHGGTLTLEATLASVIPPELTAGRSAPRQYVSISAQDTGAGIAPEALPRVFDPFFTTKEPGRGTGLGLAMVYGFVKNHDGFVNVESEPGHGARFTVSLPQIPAPAAHAATSGLGKLQLGSGTVLVVDDEPLVRAFAAAGLKGLGYKVLLAENGRQALDTYEQHLRDIDCVLLDLIMPELSGLETFRRMKELDPEVRIVFASGYSTGEILRDAPDARAAAFIGKPYTLEGLSIALRKAGVGRPRSS